MQPDLTTFDITGALAKLLRVLDPQAVVAVSVATSVVKMSFGWGRRNARLVAFGLGVPLGALLCTVDPLNPTKVIAVSWQYALMKGFYSAGAAVLGYELLEPWMPWKRDARKDDTGAFSSAPKQPREARGSEDRVWNNSQRHGASGRRRSRCSGRCLRSFAGSRSGRSGK